MQKAQDVVLADVSDCCAGRVWCVICLCLAEESKALSHLGFGIRIAWVSACLSVGVSMACVICALAGPVSFACQIDELKIWKEQLWSRPPPWTLRLLSAVEPWGCRGVQDWLSYWVWSSVSVPFTSPLPLTSHWRVSDYFSNQAFGLDTYIWNTLIYKYSIMILFL